MDESGNAFSGTYNRGNNPDDVDFTWNGKRSTDKAPEKVTPISFGGAWQGKFGEGAMVLILNQVKDQVTGQLKVNSADLGIIKEGILVGNTLRFKVFRIKSGSHSREEYLGTGELVMDNKGKSFNGNILDTAASGTLAGS